MDFKTLLANKEFILLDGAMGTMIQKSGAGYRHSPETLNLTRPELITSFHRAYIEAGADIIYTNTFGANAYKLGDSGFSAERIIAAAIANAKKACEGTQALVALDIGPVGMLAEPAGAMRFEEAYDYFKQQIIAGADADLIVLETMTDLYELKAAVLAAKENSDKPVLATMTFERGGRTFTGVSPAAAALTLTGLGVDALGVNCSLGPDELEPVIKEMTRYTDLPLIVKANAGLPDPDTALRRKAGGRLLRHHARLYRGAEGHACGRGLSALPCVGGHLRVQRGQGGRDQRSAHYRRAHQSHGQKAL